MSSLDYSELNPVLITRIYVGGLTNDFGVQNMTKKKIPSYQRKAVERNIENYHNLIKWHLEQIEKTKEKIREHEEFLESGENGKEIQ